MVYRDSGFTLIETLITTLVLVTGLTAVATLFSYGVRTSAQNEQRAAATVLLYTKMEELKEAGDWVAGDYSEQVAGDGQTQYLRTWKIEAGIPRRVTVVVYGRQPGRQGNYLEFARATLLAAPEF